GSKDPSLRADADDWVAEIVGDIASGATWVVAEGRESGTVGIYDSTGAIRTDIVAAIESAVDPACVIYEAPRREQQAGLIRRLGPAVNLGNIATADIMSVESLRVGLRTDTMQFSTAMSSRRQ
ncbi:MAG: phosphosulfolactate synthase, partial [Acidimicrobiia bacterium]